MSPGTLKTLKPLRVLILEDRADDADLVIGYLKVEGLQPDPTVVDDEAAFRAALTSSFDLIITDYSLPAFDGLSAIRVVKEMPPPRPPVIVVTGTANEDQAVECIRAGADDYLLKDRPARLGQAVRQALRRRELRDHSKDVEAGLRSRDEQLRVAQRIARMGSWEYDVETRSLTVSEGFLDIFDLRDQAEPVGVEAFLSAIYPDDRARVRAMVEHGVFAEDEPAIEYRIVRQDGDVRTILALAEVVRHSGKLIAMRGTAQDITERREAEQQLHRSEQLFRQGFDNASIGMGVVDPGRDAFALVNDAMTVVTGYTREELLSTGWLVAVTLADDREADSLMYEQMFNGSLKSNERERRLRRPDGSYSWSSWSLSPLREESGAVTGLFAQVLDITEQKRREQELEDEVNEISWIARIRDALDQDRFVLEAQPIVNLRTGRTVQHELLIRMVDKAGTAVYPGDFLPTAEKYGLITEIDQWVVAEGAKLASGGNPVTINLSAASIGSPDLLDAIERAIAKSGADPDDLVFEITETALMENLDRGELFAQKLVQLGCQVALDDFGTGFGSFTYLKRLHADYLKIDMEFVRELTRSKPDQHVVEAIVTLARGFGQQTIAEGVEDQETLVLLRELGVSHAQGYHLGRPGPPPRSMQAGERPTSEAELDVDPEPRGRSLVSGLA